MTYIAYLEEHPLRARLLTTAAQDMYGGDDPRR